MSSVNTLSTYFNFDCTCGCGCSPIRADWGVRARGGTEARPDSEACQWLPRWSSVGGPVDLIGGWKLGDWLKC